MKVKVGYIIVITSAIILIAAAFLLPKLLFGIQDTRLFAEVNERDANGYSFNSVSEKLTYVDCTSIVVSESVITSEIDYYIASSLYYSYAELHDIVCGELEKLVAKGLFGEELLTSIREPDSQYYYYRFKYDTQSEKGFLCVDGSIYCSLANIAFSLELETGKFFNLSVFNSDYNNVGVLNGKTTREFCTIFGEYTGLEYDKSIILNYTTDESGDIVQTPSKADDIALDDYSYREVQCAFKSDGEYVTFKVINSQLSTEIFLTSATNTALPMNEGT